MKKPFQGGGLLVVLILSIPLAWLAFSDTPALESPEEDRSAKTGSGRESLPDWFLRRSGGRVFPASAEAENDAALRKALPSAASRHALLKNLQISADPLAAVEAVIGALDRPAVAALLETHLGFSRAELEQSADLHQRAKKLAAAAMRGVFAEASPQPEARPASVSDMLSLTPDIIAPGGDQFASGVRKLYATAPLEGYGGPSVVAKWLRRDTRELLAMRSHPVEPNVEAVTVWLLDKNGWGAGEYSVEIYASDDEATPLAEGFFAIHESSIDEP